MEKWEVCIENLQILFIETVSGNPIILLVPNKFQEISILYELNLPYLAIVTRVLLIIKYVIVFLYTLILFRIDFLFADFNFSDFASQILGYKDFFTYINIKDYPKRDS